MKAKDITGQRFGRLVAINPHDNLKGWWRWSCQCDCGNIHIVAGLHLRNGHVKSCGCLLSESTKKRFLKHGHSPAKKETATYSSWSNMLRRCNNPKHDAYRWYGGRGIKVCERWLAFGNFLADMGECPLGCDIHRVNNDGDYEPSNCIWLPHSEHMRLHRQRVR